MSKSGSRIGLSLRVRSPGTAEFNTYTAGPGSGSTPHRVHGTIPGNSSIGMDTVALSVSGRGHRLSAGAGLGSPSPLPWGTGEGRGSAGVTSAMGGGGGFVVVPSGAPGSYDGTGTGVPIATTVLRSGSRERGNETEIGMPSTGAAHHGNQDQISSASEVAKAHAMLGVLPPSAQPPSPTTKRELIAAQKQKQKQKQKYKTKDKGKGLGKSAKIRGPAPAKKK